MMDQLLTTKDAAERCQVDPKTIQRAIHRGDLAAIRLGRCWRIRPDDFEEYLEARRVPAQRRAVPAAGASVLAAHVAARGLPAGRGVLPLEPSMGRDAA